MPLHVPSYTFDAGVSREGEMPQENAKENVIVESYVCVKKEVV